MIGHACFVLVLFAQDAPVPATTNPPTPPAPVVPAEETPAAEPPPAAAPEATPEETQPIALDEVLERAGMDTVNSLEREVKSLQQTLDGLVLADGESNVKILGAKGAEDDLESFGVDDAIARQVRRLLDEVRSRRAKLALLDLRGASSNSPNEGLRSVTEAAADEAPKPPEPVAPAIEAGTAAPDVLDGPSPDAQREATIAYRDRDVNAVLVLLTETPVLRMKPETQWIYASCLMSQRRFADAKPIFATLEKDLEHTHLAEAAKQQLRRIAFIESGLVGQGPDLEAKK